LRRFRRDYRLRRFGWCGRFWNRRRLLNTQISQQPREPGIVIAGEVDLLNAAQAKRDLAGTMLHGDDQFLLAEPAWI
jgi:hypothetical protein